MNRRAKITKKDGYRCAPEGHTVITIPFGTVVEGKIAEWALADRAASRLFDPREPESIAQDTPPETKGKLKRSRKPRKAKAK